MIVTKPDGSQETVALNEVEPGVHSVTITLTKLGLYSLLIKARGKSFSGKTFTREELRSAATWRGQSEPNPQVNLGGDNQTLVKLIEKCCKSSTRLMIVILIVLLIFLVLLLILLTR